jgi:RNA polymerase sigma factor (sigma-70 family)
MPENPVSTMLRHLRKMVGCRPHSEPTDGQLLGDFATHQDQDAFAALLNRHGRLVWSVCRHVLGHEQDAEDAFQATFLVLARKAASIRKRESVASWLHGVAYRTALRARRAAARRRAHEAKARPMPQPISETAWRNLQAALDAEVQDLEEKYRTPFVLCCLEGKSLADAAGQLGWKLGTVSGRLTQARKQLEQRLARRGIVLATVLGAATLAEDSASAAVPAALADATIKAAFLFAAGKGVAGAISAKAVALADGVLKTMLLTKARMGLALLLVVIVALAGAAVVAQHLPGAGSAARAPAPGPQPAATNPGPDGKKRPASDLYGDPLPKGASARLGTVCLKPGGSVQFVAFLPEGKTLVSDGYQSIRFWDVTTGKERRRIEVPTGWGAALSYDGKTLAVPGHLAVRLFDVATGNEILRLQGKASGPLAFSHDGRKLLSRNGKGNTFHLWDTATGKKLGTLTPPPSGLVEEYFNFSADDCTLVTLHKKDIVFTDLSTGKEARRVSAGRLLTEAAFSADGKLMAARVRADTLAVFDLVRGQVLRQLSAPHSVPYSFSRDNKVLVTAGERIVLWDLTTGKEARRLPAAGIPVAVALSRDGKLLAQGWPWQGGLHLWDIGSGQELLRRPGHTVGVSSIVFSPDGKTLASRSSQDKTLCFWEPGTGKLLRTISTDSQDRHADAGYGHAIAYSPDGRLVALGHFSGTIDIWDTKDGKEVRQLEMDVSCRFIDAVSFSPDGRTLAVSGARPEQQSSARPGRFTVFDLATGKTILDEVLTFTPRTCAFSQDHRFLALADKEKRLWLWDLGRKRPVLVLEQPGYVWQAAFSPDARYLATTTTPEQGSGWPVHLWEVASGKQVLRLEADDYRVCFTPDGCLLASGDHKAIRVWDLATRKEIARFQGHRVPVECLMFSPDGKRLATGLADSTTLVWNMAKTPGIQPRPLQPKQVERFWQDLASADAARACTAMWALSRAPEETLAYLRKHLRPATANDARRIRQLIADLGSDRFAVRESASRKLDQLGKEAEVTLRRALESDIAPETRRRIAAILSRITPVLRDPELLRGARAVEVLERLASPKARLMLRQLAAGTPDARLTQEAKASLGRLARLGSRGR